MLDINYDVRAVVNTLPKETRPATRFDSYILLLVLTQAQSDGWYGDLDDAGQAAVVRGIEDLCNRPSLLRRQVNGTGFLQYELQISDAPSQISVLALSCPSVYQQAVLDVTVKVSARNPLPYR
jgi:hypothetical protein